MGGDDSNGVNGVDAEVDRAGLRAIVLLLTQIEEGGEDDVEVGGEVAVL